MRPRRPSQRSDGIKSRRPSERSVVSGKQQKLHELLGNSHAGDPLDNTNTSTLLSRDVSGSTTIASLCSSDISLQAMELESVYTQVKMIGQGAFSVVNEVMRKDSRDLFASKTKAISLVSESEIDILKLMKHKNIVRLHECMEENSSLHLVMELCCGGDLLNLINSSRDSLDRYCTPPSSVAAQLMWQMVTALVYIHHHKICHRDVKPENYLFADSTCSVLKLADFNLSCFFTPGECMLEGHGTLDYAAPEVIEEWYTELCDVYSLGMTGHILVCGKTIWPPKATDDEVTQLVLDNDIVLDDPLWEQHEELR